jgi:hypothetical protein
MHTQVNRSSTVNAALHDSRSSAMADEPRCRERHGTDEIEALRDRLAAAEAADRERRRLLDALAEPLSVILSRLEVMVGELEEDTNPPTLGEDLKVLHRHTERMVRLLETLRARRVSWPEP